MVSALKMFFFCCVVSFLVCVAPMTIHAGSEPIRVAFLSPSAVKLHPFWNNYLAFMTMAAESLGIDLTVWEAGNRFEVVDNARKALGQPVKPEYLVYIYFAENTMQIMAMAEKAGVKSVLVNTDIVPNERNIVGKPRGKFSHWIGHIYPDDASASRQLTKLLLSKALELNLDAPDGLIHVVGAGADRATTASMYRESGLREVVGAGHGVLLDRFVQCHWKRKVARQKTKVLLELYPQAKVFWAASDAMALGVCDAMQAAGKMPGKDFLTGGIDWSSDGIDAVKNGTMEATIGGHFMDGAWALLLIHDYHNGRDFADLGATIKSHMRILNKENMDTYLPVLDRKNWKKIDFKRMSKFLNQELKEYDFSPDVIVRELACQR